MVGLNQQFNDPFINPPKMTRITARLNTSQGRTTAPAQLKRQNRLARLLATLNKKIDALEFYRYGIMPISLTAGSCWGSVACLLISMNNAPLWQLAVCAVFTMASNAVAIALAPMRWVVWSFVVSVLLNTLLVLLNLL